MTDEQLLEFRDHCVNVLNEALTADHDTVFKLINNRIPCNEALGSHPEIQCQGEPPEVGLLGIINGFFKYPNNIAAEFNDEGTRINKFISNTAPLTAAQNF